MVSADSAVLAAVSGGADSMCMLNLLIELSCEIGFRLGVVSINHGFREAAKEETLYVREYCEKGNIDFFLREIEPGECEQTEEAARVYRYNLINEVMAEGQFDRIALAHNANDKAETLLFNMFRGTGLRGMTSIRAVRDHFIRPVLCLTREEIEEYLKEENIHYYTDESNLTDDYDRNKIRHRILPQAVEINAAAVEHMNDVAVYMEEIWEYIHNQAEAAYDIVDENRGVISATVCDLLKFEGIVRRELIRMMLKDMTAHLKDITSDHIDSIENLLHRNDNARINLPYGIIVYREYDKLCLTKDDCDKQELLCNSIPVVLLKEVYESPIEIEIPGEKKLIFSIIKKDTNGIDPVKDVPRNKYTKWFDYDRINSSLSVRARDENDTIIIDDEGHTKSVNRLFIDQKVPERNRDKVAIVVAGDEVLWVVGYRETYAYRVGEDTQTILEIKLEE